MLVPAREVKATFLIFDSLSAVLLITKEKNSFIADLASGLKNWFGQAIQFMLAASDYKPFPWSKI